MCYDQWPKRYEQKKCAAIGDETHGIRGEEFTPLDMHGGVLDLAKRPDSVDKPVKRGRDHKATRARDIKIYMGPQQVNRSGIP